MSDARAEHEVPVSTTPGVARRLLPPRTRRRLIWTRHGLRRLSAELRLLPDFLVIGGQRCGTSSIFKYLSGHPEIAPSLRKEVLYFSRDFSRPLGWYKAHFPLGAARRVAESRGRRLVTFEASPEYLDHPHAPPRAARLLPHAKLVALLRHPVDRARSQHQHMTRLGFETLPFDRAVAEESRRIGADLERMWVDPDFTSRSYQRYCYTYRSKYDIHLSNWLSAFPADVLLTIRSEDMYSEPGACLGRILEFVGVDPSWRPARFENFSYRDRPREVYADMDTGFRRELERLFAPHLEGLARMTGITW